jgi:hypothetical protein
MGNSPATEAEKIAWYAQVWRQADKEAIADRRSVQKQRAEYGARRRLREAVDLAIRHAARAGAAAGAGKVGWRGHVSRLASKPNVSGQRGKYRARQQLHRVVDGAMRPALWPVLPAPPRARYEMSRTPHRRVIIS